MTAYFFAEPRENWSTNSQYGNLKLGNLNPCLAFSLCSGATSLLFFFYVGLPGMFSCAFFFKILLKIRLPSNKILKGEICTEGLKEGLCNLPSF